MQYLHHVVNLLLFLGAGFIEAVLLFEVEQLAADHELLPTDALAELMVVDVNQSKLHLLLLLAVVIVELHLRQQQLRIIVVLNLEVSSFRHVAHDLGWVGAGFDVACQLVDSERPAFWM